MRTTMILRRPRIFATIAFFLVLCLFTPTDEVHFFWEKLPIFNILFGFLGCVILIFGSKALGRLFIQKDEKYYD